MDIRKFIVPGKPKGKGRPRFARHGKHVITYTDKSTASYEKQVVDQYNEKYKKYPTFESGVIVDIAAYFPLNKSDYYPVNKNHNGELKPSGIDKINGKIKCIIKADCDNIGKEILDGLNHTKIWNDDSQITKLNISKFYSENPRVEVTIREDK